MNSDLSDFYNMTIMFPQTRDEMMTRPLIRDDLELD